MTVVLGQFFSPLVVFERMSVVRIFSPASPLTTKKETPLIARVMIMDHVEALAGQLESPLPTDDYLYR